MMSIRIHFIYRLIHLKTRGNIDWFLFFFTLIEFWGKTKNIFFLL